MKNLRKIFQRVKVFTLMLMVLSLSWAAQAQSESDFTFSNGTITDYTGSVTNVTIPDTIGGVAVTSIGHSAFENNYLTSVIIPEGVTLIEDYAFYSNQLISITLPSTLTSIGERAFYSNELTNVTIPEGVTLIGDYAFASNELTSITLPSTLTSIGNDAFSRNELTSIIISEGVTSIGARAFGTNQLTTIALPSTLTSIGNSAFKDNQLTSLSIPEGVTTIGDEAFGNNINLCSYAYSGSLILTPIIFYNCPIGHCDSDFIFALNEDLSIDYTMLTGYRGSETVVTISENVTSIGERAFYNKGLTSVSIPEGVTSIGDYAFYSNELTSVSIPEGITFIGDYVFKHNKMTSITLPSTLRFIGRSAFFYNELTSVTIPEGVTLIGEYSFCGNELTSIALPSTLTSIGDNAFGYNENLCSYTYNGPLTLTPIMFYRCPIGHCDSDFLYALNDDLSVDYTTIVDYRGSETDITIPEGVTSIGDHAFSGNELTSVTIPEGVDSIGSSVFSGNELTSITLPSTLRFIDRAAFYDNELTSISIPEGVTSIGDRAFNYNPFGSIVFENNSNLSTFVLPEVSGYDNEQWHYTPASGSADDVNNNMVTEFNGTYTFVSGTLIEYSITYNNGVTTNPVTYNIESSTISLAAPQDSIGYVFAGWYDNSEFDGDAITEIPQGSIGDKDLYVQWAKLYDVIFDINGGTGSMDNQSIAFNFTVALNTNILTKDGYQFTAWNTASDGTGTSYADGADFTMETEGDTLYAQWSVVSSVTDNTNATCAVYPNPAQDFVTLQGFTQGEMLNVYSLMGKQVLSVANTNNSLNISELPVGVYCLKGANTQVIRFVKE